MANYFLKNLRAVSDDYEAPKDSNKRYNRFYDPDRDAATGTMGAKYANSKSRYENRIAIPFMFKDKQTGKKERGIIFALPKISFNNDNMVEANPFSYVNDKTNGRTVLGGYLLDSPISYDGKGILNMIRDRAEEDSVKVDQESLDKASKWGALDATKEGIRAGFGEPNYRLPDSDRLAQGMNDAFRKENGRNSWLYNWRTTGGNGR